MKSARGRLSSIDLLPAQAEPILTEIKSIVIESKMMQKDIYPIFQDKLKDIGFEAPSYSSFCRWVKRIYIPNRRDKVKFESWQNLGFDFPVSGRVNANTQAALKRLARDKKTTVSMVINELVTSHLQEKGYLPK